MMIAAPPDTSRRTLLPESLLAALVYCGDLVYPRCHDCESRAKESALVGSKSSSGSPAAHFQPA
jgi:hypothetical protein